MVQALRKEPTQPAIKAELDALNKIVVLMEGADDDTRRRIMAYLNSRYPFYAWPR
jgi:hypothetical protein